MTSIDHGRSLLVGLIAQRLGFVSTAQFDAAVSDWRENPSITMDELLSRRRLIDDDVRAFVREVAAKHESVHHGDIRESLRAVDPHSAAALDSGSTVDLAADRSLEETQSFTEEQRELGRSEEPTAANPVANRFRIIKPHAKGGLGEVSLAMDSELNRTVALKEIQGRFADRPESRDRFTLEAEVTGKLEHPGVVPVYGFGTRENGRPYYAMRFIRGESLKEATDRFHKSAIGKSPRAIHGLEFRKLLGRFIDVANAIQYAHSRHVLHRDIKPANIMLGKYGETLVVDWGLSKVLGNDESLSESVEVEPLKTSATSASATLMGSTIGTPAFMSPEQAEGRLDDLDAASDVYSLGATLYYLVTGQTPLGDKQASDWMERIRAGDFAPPRSINGRIPRALDAVVRKAMAICPSDRYSSAESLAAEMERWLADEPVQALPEPLSARCWRWIRRHQTQVAASALATIVALASLATATVVVANSNRQLFAANVQLDAANGKLDRQNQQLIAANEKTRRAETEASNERDVAVAISDFLRHDLLRYASPDEEPIRDIEMRTVLDRAAIEIANRFPDRPLVEAAIRETIGNAYNDLGEYEAALVHLKRCHELRVERLGEASEDTLQAVNNLAETYRNLSQPEMAEPLIAKALQTLRDLFGEDYEGTTALLGNLASLHEQQGRYAKAEAVYKQNIDTFRRLDDKPALATALPNLAGLYGLTDRFADAMPLLKEAEKLTRQARGDEHPETLSSVNSLALAHGAMGDTSKAKELFEKSIQDHIRILKEKHPQTLQVIANAADFYQGQLNFARAESLWKRLLDIHSQSRSDDNRASINAMNNLGALYSGAGRNAEAEPLLKRALASCRVQLGDNDPLTLATKHNLGQLFDTQRNYAEAAPLLEDLVATHRETLGESDPKTLFYWSRLGRVRYQLKQYEKSIPIFETILRIQQDVYGDTHPGAVQARANLAVNLLEGGKVKRAIPLLVDFVENDRGIPPALRGSMRQRLMGALEANGEPAEAERFRREDLERTLARNGDEHIATASAYAALAQNQLLTGNFSEAETAARKSLAIRTTKTPDSWQLASAKDLTGAALLGQKRYAEAKSLLIEGFLGLEKHKQEIPKSVLQQRLPAAAKRIIVFYEATGDEEKAQQWREQLGHLNADLGLSEDDSPMEERDARK